MVGRFRISIIAAVSTAALAPTGWAWGQTDCGAVLTTDTVLSGNLQCEGNALSIRAGGITLDCSGHTIRGNLNPGTTGVSVIGVSGVTIRNCTIIGFTYGIRAAESPGLAIVDNVLTSNLFSGLHAEQCARLRVENTSLKDQPVHLRMIECPEARVVQNHLEPLTHPFPRGVILALNCPRSLFAQNSSTGRAGISIWAVEPNGADEVVVADNNFVDLSAVAISGAVRCRIAGNQLGPAGPGAFSTGAAIAVYSSSECEVTDNIVEGPRLSGIFLVGDIGPDGSPQGADRNLVTGNRIQDAIAGVLIAEGSDNRVANNSILNAAFGFLVFPSSFTMVRSAHNHFEENHLIGGALGIGVEESAGNRFVRNRLSGQWLGILDEAFGPPALEPNIYFENEIADSDFFGFLIIGSSPEILGNDLTGNGNGTAPPPSELEFFGSLLVGPRGGLALLPLAGRTDSLDDGDPTNDLLPRPRIGSVREPNRFQNNGSVDIYSIDTPLGDWREILEENLFQAGPTPSASLGDHADLPALIHRHNRIRQDWFGLVRAENPTGTPATEATVEVRDATDRLVGRFMSGSGGFAPADADPLRPQGLDPYAPGGPVPAWPRFTEYVVDHSGRRLELTPHRLRVQSAAGVGNNAYSWDGLDNDPDAHQIINGRYQIARGRTGNACEAFDDLRSTIEAAPIAREGIRRSLLAKVTTAQRLFTAQAADAAGRVLCALLTEARTQSGYAIPTESASSIVACTRDSAAVLIIPLRCDGSVRQKRGPEKAETIALPPQP